MLGHRKIIIMHAWNSWTFCFFKKIPGFVKAVQISVPVNEYLTITTVESMLTLFAFSSHFPSYCLCSVISLGQMQSIPVKIEVRIGKGHDTLSSFLASVLASVDSSEFADSQFFHLPLLLSNFKGIADAAVMNRGIFCDTAWYFKHTDWCATWKPL